MVHVDDFNRAQCRRYQSHVANCLGVGAWNSGPTGAFATMEDMFADDKQVPGNIGFDPMD
jgi:hypothetical protein